MRLTTIEEHGLITQSTTELIRRIIRKAFINRRRALVIELTRLRRENKTTPVALLCFSGTTVELDLFTHGYALKYTPRTNVIFNEHFDIANSLLYRKRESSLYEKELVSFYNQLFKEIGWIKVPFDSCEKLLNTCPENWYPTEHVWTPRQ